MKKKLFLHVGPPKTGTTTVQHFLAQNRDKLASAGILYPLNEPSHWKLALRVGLTMWPWTVDETTTPSWSEIAQLSAENADKHLLLSSESFSYAVLSAKKEGSIKLVEQLRSLDRELHVIIYLRRQDLWVESYFIEYLKHFGKGGLDTFLEERQDSLDYYKVLSFWSNLAGKDRLTVRVYEPGQLPDIRADFMRFLGIEDLSGFRPDEDKNHRPSLLQMQVLNNYVETFHKKFPAPPGDFNKPYGPMDTMLGGFLYKASHWPSTHKYRILPYRKAEQIMSGCEASNARVAREFLDRADGRLFYEKLSPYEHDELHWPPLPDAEQKAAIGTLWRETCDLMGEPLEISGQDGYSEFEKTMQAPKETDMAQADADYSVERYAPEMTDFKISYEHWHRYLYATNFSKGKTVLDIASGEGYGAFLLAENAAKVVGVDIDGDAVRQATQKYHRKNLSFLEGSVSRIPIEGTARFDLIVSFETIEHVDAGQQAAFMGEVKRLLKPGGVFIVSTPDKLVYSDLPNYRNEFHVKEFYAAEFRDFLQGSFKYVEILGQDIYTSSYIRPATGPAGVQEYNLALDASFKPQDDTARQDAYMVAACSDNSLSPLPSSLLFNSKNKQADYDLSYQVLYVDTGAGFNEKDALRINILEKDKAVVFDLSGFPGIKNLRFDPAACPVYLKISGVWLKTKDGQQTAVDFSTNAVQEEAPFFLFDTEDPQVLLDLPNLEKFNTIVFDLEYVAIGAAVYPYLKNFVEQQINGSAAKNALLESSLGSKENEISRLSQELQTSSLLLHKIEDQLALHRRLAEQAEANAIEKKATIDALGQRLSEALELLKSKDGHFQQLLENLQGALSTVKTLEFAVAEKDAGLKAKEERILTLSSQFDNSLRDAEALRLNLLSKEETIARTAEKMNFLEEQLEQYKVEKSVSAGQYSSLETSLNEEQARSNELLARLREALARLNELRANLGEEEAKTEDLQARLKEEQAKSEGLQARLGEERTKLEEMQAGLEEEQARSEDLQARLEEEQARSEDLQARLEEEQARSEDLQVTLSKEEAILEKVLAKSKDLEARLDEERERSEDLHAKLDMEQAMSRQVQKKLNAVETENNARGKHIEHLNGFVGTLENDIHEKDRQLTHLQLDSRQKMQYIGELKSSLSFRLGWALTAPFRWVFDGLKMGFWMNFLGIALKNPGSFFKNINPEKIAILRKALKNEPPSLILRNFINLLSGSGRQMAVAPKKEEPKPLPPATKEEPKAALPQPKPPAENIESRKTHYFIDQLEELDFHFSIRGWLFVESHEIKSLSIAMSQGDQEVKSELFYHIDRPDVFHHYGNRNGLRSGFADSVEKPFSGKARLSLIATLSDGTQTVTDLGETDFREPFLRTFSSAILANRAEFKALNGREKSGKPSVALYTNAGGNYFFNEIKALVAKGFQSVGYAVHELDETAGFDNDALLHIVIAPHEFFEIGEGKKYVQKPSDRLILLNTEQPSSAWFRKGTAYFPHAVEVWDMNHYSWERLQENIAHARFLPLGFVKDFGLLAEVRQLPENYCTCFLDEKIRKGSFLQRNFEDRPIDILFVGHASPRRQQFFARNAAFFAKYNCYFHLTDIALGPVLDTKTNMNTRTAIGLAQRSKIILNIHHGTHPYFEWHRMVMHGMWQRGLVISDLCGEGPPFVAGRDFVQAPLDELPEKIAYFLETDAGKKEAREIIQSAYTVLTSQCDLAHKLQELVKPLLDTQKAIAHSPPPSPKRNNKSKKHGRKRATN
ncbi:MAG: methyltransferase domain-containing protein [Lewinellaceae bacterium]|nr:methyltransferase domain-containing protein [Saprospiraceae bacterium]MCB9342045.1 methyltransferase domain-containing protein [Lewinellaceae bacterium]